MVYRKASGDDIDLLVSQRLKFVEVEESDWKYAPLKENCHAYFSRAFAGHGCDVILAEEDGSCVGTGIIFYYDSVPSAFNVTGKNAYITSMYVEPSHRRKGIGKAVLKRLLECAGEKGCRIILLSASDMGRPMYEKMGFKENENGMILVTGPAE